MATKPKAILSTHDGREASPITRASNVLFKNGQTAQDILNDRQDAMISPVIENSSSMFKVGQGDDVDYSANVVNGAYESMVLKGKSMVNCIQEPSSKDVVLPYEFEDGQYVTINDTKESGALGVELKGQTLVNIHDKKTPSLAAAENDWYSNLVIETNSISFTVAKLPENWRYINFKSLNLSMLKPNTKYLVAFEEASGVSTVTFKNGDSTHPLSDTVQIVSNKAIVTTTSDWVNSAQILYIYVPARNVGAEVKVKNPMIIEYVEGMENWDIPYFKGMTSCKMPILRTVGKNLFDSTQLPTYAVQDAVVGFGGVFKSLNNGVYTTANYGAIGWDIALEEGQTYTLSLKGRYLMDKNTNSSGFMCTIGINNKLKDNRVYGEARTITHSYTFVATKTTKIGIGIVAYGVDGTDCEIYDIQLEKTSSATTYEPHKSSILSLPEEVVLRSLPNGVCDTFNTRTGVYTQRIGELVLDGSEQGWTLGTSANWYADGDTFGFYFNDFKLAQGTSLYIDKFLSTPSIAINDMEGCYISTQWSWVGVRIYKTKLPSLTVDAFKQWLSQNHITIQYELATPVVTKINLSSTLKSWNTTTHIYSEIPENTLYPILSHSNPSYPVILKPSTKYSIVANSYSNNHTNSAINFNLGGATASTTVGNRVTTITTPSTLNNELLTMSGRGNKLNNVMVIEGDVVGDEPYFEGICDCKSPILSNVGKNLFDNVFTVGGWWDGVPDCNPDLMRSVNLTPVKPNTTYAYDSTVKGHRQSANFMAHDADGNFIKYLGFGRTFTTPSNCHYIHLYAENDNSLYAQIEEGNVSTTIEPYKSNILSANGDEIKLTEDMFEQGGVSYPNTYPTTSTFDSIKYPSDHRIRMKDLHSIKPNTTHKIKIQNGDSYWIGLQGYNNDGVPINFDTSWGWHGGECVFTTPSNMTKFAIAIRKPDSSVITLSDFGKIEFELREVDKTIVLRSLPNGVCDTLNVETGEYVQRIGELVVNGDNTVSYTAISTGAEKTIRVAIAHSSIKIVSNEHVICAYCNNLGYKYNYQDDKDFESFFVANSNNRIFMRLAKSKLETLDIAGVKKYFSKNPYIFQYELAKPIVSTVDVQGFPYAYANGHVQLSSGSIEQSLTPRVEYSVATNRNGQIRSNQKMVERHQKQLDQLQAIILANLVNSQYNQTLTTLKYELSRV